MRSHEMITKGKCFDLLTNFLNYMYIIFKEICGD